MTAYDAGSPVQPNTDAVCRMRCSDADWAIAVDLYVGGQPACEMEEPRIFAQRRMTARRGQQEAGLGGWFGAFVEGQLLCRLGLFTDGSGFGRFQDVQTLLSARRRVLASTLVHHAGRAGARDLGIRDLVMVADPDHSATRIYRSLGFTEAAFQIQLARPRS